MPFDLLRVPVIGHFLRWRFSRPLLQTLMASLAALVIFDGLTGPQISPLNLAGVLPWIHWRGLLILSLLMAGNFFCMACPFMLVRNMMRYADGGACIIEVVSSGRNNGVRLTFSDKGPGIPDLQAAMRDGFSTGKSLGLGLPGTKRLVNEFDIKSKVGEGTVVVILKWANG